MPEIAQFAVYKPTQAVFAPKTILSTVFICTVFLDVRRSSLRSKRERGREREREGERGRERERVGERNEREREWERERGREKD